MAGRYRPRKEYKFWLFHDLPEHARLMEFIDYCKSTRQFAKVVRDGIRLVWSLREGNLSILFELFPHLERQFNPDAQDLITEFREMLLQHHVAPAPVQQSLPGLADIDPPTKPSKLSAAKIAMPLIIDDDDGDTIVLNKSAGTANGANLFAGIMGLGD